MINAIPTSPTIAFLIEERQIATVEYKISSPTSNYDDLEYTFNFEAVIPNAMLPDVEEPGFTVQRIASQFIDVINDTSYTMVLGGDLLNPTVTVWERPEPEFAEGGNNFEVQIGHVGATLGAVDVYFADPGTPPAAGGALGTIAAGEVLPVESLAAGEFVLTLTTPDDPATELFEAELLFESEPITGAAGNAYIFVAFDPDGTDNAPVAMRSFNISSGQGVLVPAANAPATYRFFHASADTGAVDIYVDDPLTEPALGGLDFTNISADIPMPGVDVPITLTAAGNQGVVVADVDRSLLTGLRYFAYLVENTEGGASLVDYLPDLRSVETFAKLSVISTVPRENGVDFYAISVDSETTLEDAPPRLVGLIPGITPVKLEFVENSYDVYVTVAGEKTVLAGPLTLELARGDIVQAVIYENVDPAVVDVALVPLP